MIARHGPQLPPPWDKLTLLSLAESASTTAPARIFLRDCPHREGWNDVEPRTLSYDGYFKAAHFLAAQLKTLGVEAGNRVLLLLPNTVEIPIAILACHFLGAVPAIAPVDERVDTLRAAAERCGATAILTTARVGEIALGNKARQVAAKVLSIRCVGGFGFDLPDGIVSLEGWSEEDVVELPERDRHQSDAGLITFHREADSLCAMLRTDGQMVAEALALSSVVRLDGRRGLISLMQPGSAASVAAGLVLPLHAVASVRLIGPYDTGAITKALSDEPTAFLYVPDHFAAQLAPETFGPGKLKNIAGLIALAHAERPNAQILPPGSITSTLAINFGEHGLMTTSQWPRDGQLALPLTYMHPMESVLPPEVAMLTFTEDGGTVGWSGFGAAEVIRREDAEKSGRAA